MTSQHADWSNMVSLPVDQAKRLAESEIKIEVVEEKDTYRIVSYHPPPLTPEIYL
jgi:hypothetical protein